MIRGMSESSRCPCSQFRHIVRRCEMGRASKGYDGIGSEKEEINGVFGYIIYPEKTSDLEPHYDIIIMLLVK